MMNQANVIKPNFFIIGAPKCGTTALSEYLSTHPDVLFARPKEPKYFHTDFADGHRHALTLADYLQCFDRREIHQSRAVGEATVWYLYSRVAVANILEYNPHAKFIVMVRSPVELAYSLHSQLLYGGHEDEGSFETAWRLQSARTHGERIPPTCPDAKALQYGEIAKLGEQIERLYAQAPRENVKVLLLSDLRRNAEQVYQNVLSFLDLPPDERATFPIVNRNRSLRFRGLARFFYIGSSTKRRLGMRRSFGIWRALTPILAPHSKRPPLTDSLKAELQSFFREDISKLSDLIEHDLSDWCG